MSIISGYLNQVGQLKVEGAAVFFDGPAAASLEPLLITDIGGDAFYIKAEKTDGEATDHWVKIDGKLDADVVSETLNFGNYATRTKYGCQYFTEVTALSSNMDTEDPLPRLRIVAVDEGGAEITSTSWENFACRWEEKSSHYFDSAGVLTLSDAKVMISSSQITNGDHIRLVTGGIPGDDHEIKKMRPATGLPGSELFRTLLL